MVGFAFWLVGEAQYIYIIYNIYTHKAISQAQPPLDRNPTYHPSPPVTHPRPHTHPRHPTPKKKKTDKTKKRQPHKPGAGPGSFPSASGGRLRRRRPWAEARAAGWRLRAPGGARPSGRRSGAWWGSPPCGVWEGLGGVCVLVWLELVVRWGNEATAARNGTPLLVFVTTNN